MDPALEAILVVGGVGAAGGLIGGFFAGADNLTMTVLIGIIGGVALSALFQFGQWPGVYTYGEDEWSLLWGGVGGLVLGFSVGRANG